MSIIILQYTWHCLKRNCHYLFGKKLDAEVADTNNVGTSNLHPGRLTAKGTYIFHPFRKENDLNQTSMTLFHVNLQGCILLNNFTGSAGSR